MTHAEARRMLERNDDSAMGEDEARSVMVSAEAAGLPVDPAWIVGPGPMPTSFDSDDAGPMSLVMIGL